MAGFAPALRRAINYSELARFCFFAVVEQVTGATQSRCHAAHLRPAFSSNSAEGLILSRFSCLRMALHQLGTKRLCTSPLLPQFWQQRRRVHPTSGPRRCRLCLSHLHNFLPAFLRLVSRIPPIQDKSKWDFIAPLKGIRPDCAECMVRADTIVLRASFRVASEARHYLFICSSRCKHGIEVNL